jgi:hypothetical protein
MKLDFQQLDPEIESHLRLGQQQTLALDAHVIAVRALEESRYLPRHRVKRRWLQRAFAKAVLFGSGTPQF